MIDKPSIIEEARRTRKPVRSPYSDTLHQTLTKMGAKHSRKVSLKGIENVYNFLSLREVWTVILFENSPLKNPEFYLIRNDSLEEREAAFFERVKALPFYSSFSYDKVKFVDLTTPIIVTCAEHGDFEITPDGILKSQFGGCRDCSYQRRPKKEYDFISLAKDRHKNKYDYSKSIYIDNDSVLIITCPIHGDFKQIARNHLASRGCQKCGKLKTLSHSPRPSTEEFIARAKAIKHNVELYNYDKSVYVNRETKLIITCIEHGDFLQTPDTHFKGSGCSVINHKDKRFKA